MTEALSAGPTVRRKILESLARLREEIEELDRPKDKREATGAYTVELKPEQLDVYLPLSKSLRRPVDPEELQAAKTWWNADHTRGKGLRAAALAELGPLLKPSEVADHLGVSRMTVNNWRRHNKLLAIRLDDSQYLYPAFQFASLDNGEQGLLQHFTEILRLLPHASTWAKAKFFLQSMPALGGRTPLDVLKSRNAADLEQLRHLAPEAGEMGS